MTALDKLQKKFSMEVWLDLAKSTMIYIQLFNRRRPGEIERMNISNFQNRQSVQPDTNKELYNSLPKEAQMAVDKYQKVIIRGKKSRPVCVLLSQNMICSLDLVLQNRSKAKVSKANNRVFGIRHSVKKDHHLNACHVMRNYAEECGAERPDLLRATKLRKHIATKGVIFQYTESEMSFLAKILGHEPGIHKKYYRQAVPEIEISKMAQILESAMGSLNEDFEKLDDEDSDSQSDSDSSSDEPEEMNIPLALEKPRASRTKNQPLLRKYHLRSTFSFVFQY